MAKLKKTVIKVKGTLGRYATPTGAPAMTTKLIQMPDLDLLLSAGTIEGCQIEETRVRGWTFTLHIRNHKDGSLVDYRLVSQRGKKREWSDPRTMFRLLRDHYHVHEGHFKLR